MTRYLIPPTPAEDLPPPAPTAEDFNIPAEAFGARTAFGALEPGESLHPGHWDEANRANSTRAAELQNQFLDRQREILHTGPDAYLGKTGRDAVLGAPDVLSQLEAARQETIGQAANEAQRKILTSALGEHRITEHYRVGTHAGEQSLEWQKQTATERLNQLRQQAALDYADPGSIEAYAKASESAGRERARTMKFGATSPEAFREVEGARSAIWRQAIEAALGRFDTRSAIILYNQAADGMTPADSGVLAPQIDAAKEHQAGQEYLATLPIPDSRDLTELDAAHQAATEQNNADWPDNDSQRATNQHFIDTAIGEQKRGIAQAKVDLDQSVKNWLSQPDQMLRPPPDLWARLGPEARRAVDDQLAQNALNPRPPETESPTGRRGIAPIVEPLPGSPEHERAVKEGLPEISGPIAGLGHWLFGSGEPVRYPFDKIDTTSVTPEQFPAVQEILHRGEPGTYEIDGKMPFWAGKNFDSRFLVGRMWLHLKGKLVVGSEGNYSFKGELGGLPDTYRMYDSKDRKEVDEGATRAGKILGSLGHADYKIQFLGEKPIGSSGNYAP